VKSNFYLKCFLSLLSAFLIVWLASRRTFHNDTISSPFLSIALLSVLLFLLRTRCSWREVGAVLVLGLALAFLDVRFLGYRAAWPVWPFFFGLASLAVLASRLAWSERTSRRLAVCTLVPVFLFVASEWCADYFLAWTKRVHPMVLDLYSFDASLHVQTPFVAGRLFEQWSYFRFVSFCFYAGLPLVIGLAFAGSLMRDRRNALPAFLALFLTGPVGALFYDPFPPLGPVHIFRESFPRRPLGIEQALRLVLQGIPGQGARNAMPSLHAAWVFLALWYSWGLAKESLPPYSFSLPLCHSWARGALLRRSVVAVPFTVFIVALANLLAGRERHQQYLPFLTGLSMTGLWFLALRHATRAFWVSPVVPWLCCGLALAVCFIAARKLAMPQCEPEFKPYAPECPTPEMKIREA
jgi:hypothetical protein